MSEKQKVKEAGIVGWILYKDSAELLRPEAYEVHRLVDVAKSHDIDLKVLSPEQIDIIVTREDRKSILVDEAPTALPDFLLPRMAPEPHTSHWP